MNSAASSLFFAFFGIPKCQLPVGVPTSLSCPSKAGTGAYA
jgi:hypothetical protein